jgi:hypothetical protein
VPLLSIAALMKPGPVLPLSPSVLPSGIVHSRLPLGLYAFSAPVSSSRKMVPAASTIGEAKEPEVTGRMPVPSKLVCSAPVATSSA